MTLQTSTPLARHSLQASARSAREIARLFSNGDGDLSPEYQRGSVWNEGQRVGLVKSWLMGVPIPSVIVSDRMNQSWTQDGPDGLPRGGYIYAVIDGKQRVETAVAWFAGEIAVPASWFPAEEVESTEDTNDGPYVRYTGLTDVARRVCSNRFMLPTVMASVATVAEEAALYVLVNGGGVAQSEEDMANAARVAGV